MLRGLRKCAAQFSCYLLEKRRSTARGIVCSFAGLDRSAHKLVAVKHCQTQLAGVSSTPTPVEAKWWRGEILRVGDHVQRTLLPFEPKILYDNCTRAKRLQPFRLHGAIVRCYMEIVLSRDLKACDLEGIRLLVDQEYCTRTGMQMLLADVGITPHQGREHDIVHAVGDQGSSLCALVAPVLIIYSQHCRALPHSGSLECYKNGTRVPYL